MGNQYLSLVHELAFESPFPVETYLAQPTYMREGLFPTSIDITDFVDSQCGNSPF